VRERKRERERERERKSEREGERTTLDAKQYRMMTPSDVQQMFAVEEVGIYIYLSSENRVSRYRLMPNFFTSLDKLRIFLFRKYLHCNLGNISWIKLSRSEEIEHKCLSTKNQVFSSEETRIQINKEDVKQPLLEIVNNSSISLRK